MTSEMLRDVTYRIPWRASGVRAGVHKSRHTGGGGLFNDLAPFVANPDPRRIAVKASLTDPFEQLLVSRFQQTSAISVHILIDVSASMGCTGRADKMDIACDLAAALAICATRAGDKIAILACDSGIQDEFNLPATRSIAAASAVIDRLREYRPSKSGVAGLAAAAQMVAGRKKLVVIISDFQWSDDDVSAIFSALLDHDCLAIEIHDTGLVAELPDWGLLRLRDSETGAQKLVAMRPSLKAAWQQREQKRREFLTQRASQTGRDLFSVSNEINWDQLASYLMHGSAA